MKICRKYVNFGLIFLLILVLNILTLAVYATHQRAGEITYRHVSGLTYEIIITTYTFAPSSADRCELLINWGDGEKTMLTRSNGIEGVTPAGITCPHIGEMITDEIRLNIYKGIHTYPANGIYKIWLEDPNRNMGVENIPNSVEVPFYIETLLTINPFIGVNNSPILTQPPIDNGCVQRLYLHNATAYDPDGDSLSYKLVKCKGAGGLDIIGYVLPNQTDGDEEGIFELDPVSGTLTWNSPTKQGEYNFAFIIEEWRKGIRIGYVTRDMQVNIIACNNTPPVINGVYDTCVVIGDTLKIDINAIDNNSNVINLYANGNIFLQQPNNASFVLINQSQGAVSKRLIWSPNCKNLNQKQYQVVFKADDNEKPVPLFDIKSMFITVIAPPVGNISTEPLGNKIKLKWDKYKCSNIKGYKIYRRSGTSSLAVKPCDSGVPAELGYKLINVIEGVNNTEFIDNNGGAGLFAGINYCYIITAFYGNDYESKISEQTCSALKKDMPTITNVNVLNTSENTGQVAVTWAKPTELDFNNTPGPFIVILYRSENFEANSPIEVARFYNLTDTSYIDKNLNTKDKAWNYKIEFINNTPDNYFSIGFSPTASSVYIKLLPTDKQINITIKSVTPWTNEQYCIYRYNNASAQFDSITTVNTEKYTDLNLENGKDYCYKVQSFGTYGVSGYVNPIINYSQEQCVKPIDNQAPCSISVQTTINCNNSSVLFEWNDIRETCAPDLKHYLLYKITDKNEHVATINNDVTSFILNDFSIINGCFFIVGVDTLNNVDTTNFNKVCVSLNDCPKYKLPNVFTPNGDEINDIFTPFPGYTAVERIDITIFNRWGNVVFRTTDPKIKWNGKYHNTNNDCAEGVYFYNCHVWEYATDSENKQIIVKRTINGSIHLLR